ncbi:MAG: iron-sulfur cluster co-chaperone HscB C-terminal domain-containing protein [Candidatus Thermochlorobacter sp.]
MQDNYFELFGLPEKLNLDTQDLQKKFYALSRAVHPDFHQTALDAQKSLSLEVSSKLNQAFLTLKDREKRLNYVLTKYLGEMSEAEKKQTPPELLMRLMDIREHLEAFKHQPSDTLKAQLEAECATLQAEQQALDQRIDALAQEFDSASSPEAKRAALTEIRKLMLKKNYLRSLLTTIQNELHPTL